MGKPYIIYHAACTDGFGAALSAWKKFGNEADYKPAAHGDSPPPVKDRDVYILDYCYKRPVIEALRDEADSLTILDHHISAQKDLEGFEGALFNMDKSGARLAWEHFHPDTPIPDLILNIEDRDLWKWEITGSRALTAALETHRFSFKTWDRWLSGDLDDLRKDGEAILRYQEQMVRRISRRPDTQVIAGFKVPCVNCPILSSEIGNILCQGKPFAVIWREANGQRTYSMRSTDKGEDVSAIAAAFGGGGHPRAAGFTVPIGHDISRLPDPTK